MLSTILLISTIFIGSLLIQGLKNRYSRLKRLLIQIEEEKEFFKGE